MEETPERLDRVGRIEALGPEAEHQFASGNEAVPLILAHRVDPVVELIREGKNVALVGRSGSGRRSLALGLRRSTQWGEGCRTQLTLPLSKGPHPNSFPVYRTTIRHWLDGALYTSNLEQKISLIIRRTTEDVIILFEGIHQAIGAWRGRGESMDLVDLLVDVAGRPNMHMVVTATPEGWARMKAEKPDFVARFVVVDVPPPDVFESRLIIDHWMEQERSRGHRYRDAAVDEAFRMSARYFVSEPPLGPVIRLLSSASPSSSAEVDDECVRQECARQLGLQRRWIGTDRLPNVDDIVAELEEEVVGQRAACVSIAHDIVSWACGLGEFRRPRSYMLAGPPGVGKTSLACAVQRLLGGTDAAPVRFDCSEFSASPMDAMRLIANTAGSLASGLLHKPAAVVLLDEVDRLHPSARGLLYQILGEGRLTTLDGEVVSTSNAVVFMTSNVGSSGWFRPGIRESGWDRAEAATRRACGAMLGEAVTSRVTRVIVCPPLGADSTAQIVRWELDRLAAAPILHERGIALAPTQELIAKLALLGTSSTNGARGLHKVVNEFVAVPLSQYLCEQDVEGGRLIIESLDAVDVMEGVRLRMDADKAGSNPTAASSETGEASTWNWN